MDDFASLQSSIQSSLVSTTRAASTLANEDLPFHRSLSTQLATNLERQNARLLQLATNLLGAATAAEESVRPTPTLKDVDAIDGNWRAVVDVVDSLLERADIALDEFTGAVKRLSPGVVEQGNATKPAKISKIAQQLKAQEMEKPQLRFEHVPTNREAGPFRPLLLNKPHALVPLETEPIATDEDSQSQYPHPYQLEIEQYRYPTSVYTLSDPIPYHAFDSTTATFVDTEEALDEMLDELRQAKEVAIDLEHHDQRSYVGIVCLMQISTRNRDWIVDTLKPWRRKLHVLNEVFADPSIVKILHGAYMDIVWLQRDLGLYLVGLFDTHYAARALGYPGGSLAFLLKKFANVDAQKQYQMADWRIRPLPQELFDYARSDTHYLLYIFDCMRNELIQRSNFPLPNHEGDKLWQVLQKSGETALQRYEHAIYDAELGQGPVGWYKILSRTPALFTKEQFSVFRAIHQWRDEVGREQDDSVHYVMPNHQVFSLAREMPINRAALLGLAQPTTQTVRLRADELVGVVLKAKESGSEGPEMLDVLNRIEPHHSRSKLDKTEPTSHSVAAYLPRASLLADRSELSTGLPLRSAISTFWGNTFGGEAQRRELSTSVDGVSLTVPMPPLTAEIFVDDPAEVIPPIPISSGGETSSPTETPENQDDDTFVLKDLVRKRKRNTADLETHTTLAGQVDGMAAQSDEVSVPDEESEHLREKAERKKARKEAKRAARLASSTSAKGNGGEEEPFDYASAPSMLNPSREMRMEASNEKGRKKQVNPYAKSMDAPKGMPRNPAAKERAGRSMTYGYK